MKNIAIIGVVGFMFIFAGCGNHSGIRSDFTPAPKVVSTSPTGTNVPVATTAITVQFDKSIDCSAINFSVTAAGQPVTGTVFCSGTSANFTLFSALHHEQPYRVVVSGVMNNVERAMEPYTWDFTTESTPIVTLPTSTLWKMSNAVFEFVAADANGNIFASGETYSVGADGGVIANSKDVFTAKLNADGTMAWVDKKGTANDDYSYSLLAVNGKVYSYWYEKVMWTGKTYLSMYDFNGEIKTMVSPSNAYAKTSTLANDGNYYLYGYSDDPNSQGSLLAKIDQNGNIVSTFGSPFPGLSAYNGYAYGTGMTINGLYTAEADFNTGTAVWEAYFRTPTGGNVASTAIVADATGAYVFGTDVPVTDPNHGRIIQYDLNGKFIRTVAGLGSPSITEAVISDNDYLYAGGYGGLTKYRKSDFSVVWNQPNVAGDSIVILNGVIYSAEGLNGIIRLNASDGKRI